jgi:hypothetical protein
MFVSNSAAKSIERVVKPGRRHNRYKHQKVQESRAPEVAIAESSQVATVQLKGDVKYADFAAGNC